MPPRLKRPPLKQVMNQALVERPLPEGLRETPLPLELAGGPKRPVVARHALAEVRLPQFDLRQLARWRPEDWTRMESVALAIARHPGSTNAQLSVSLGIQRSALETTMRRLNAFMPDLLSMREYHARGGPTGLTVGEVEARFAGLLTAARMGLDPFEAVPGASRRQVSEVLGRQMRRGVLPVGLKRASVRRPAAGGKIPVRLRVEQDRRVALAVRYYLDGGRSNEGLRKALKRKKIRLTSGEATDMRTTLRHALSVLVRPRTSQAKDVQPAPKPAPRPRSFGPQPLGLRRDMLSRPRTLRRDFDALAPEVRRLAARFGISDEEVLELARALNAIYG